MVNEQRLHSMIKIAKFDANDGKRCKPMIQYARKDLCGITASEKFRGRHDRIFYDVRALGTLFYGCFDGTDQQNGFCKGCYYTGTALWNFMVIYLLATYIFLI